MEFLRHAVILVHLIGFAVLFGSWVVAAGSSPRRFTRVMDWGLALAAIAGLALAAPWGTDGDLNYVKIAVKLVVLLVIGAVLGIGSARQKRGVAVAPALFWSVGVLTLLNAGLGVLWR